METQSAPANPETIHIAGREFRAVTESTLAHDQFMREHLFEANRGAMTLVEDETPVEYAGRVYTAMVTGGTLYKILSGVLLPATLQPYDWTAAVAAETEIFLSRVTDAEGKRTISKQAGALIAGFYAAAKRTSMPSRRFLSPVGAA